jgi:phosphate starvation-inducible PhoH-like protein
MKPQIRKKPNRGATIKPGHLSDYEPFSDNQAKAWKSWKEGKNLVMSGSPGTGKTFMAMNFALKEVLESGSDYDQLVVVRSIVPTRDIGFLPGDEEEKKKVYMAPYQALCSEITEDPSAWHKLLQNKKVEFQSTSFIRGVTYDNAIIIVDEMQNLNFHELDSVITRVGVNCRIIFCGDYHQSDFRAKNERDGIIEFLSILYHMKDFDIIEFGWQDIIRSGIVRDYIMTKEMLASKKSENENEKISNRSGS